MRKENTMMKIKIHSVLDTKIISEI